MKLVCFPLKNSDCIAYSADFLPTIQLPYTMLLNGYTEVRCYNKITYFIFLVSLAVFGNALFPSVILTGSLYASESRTNWATKAYERNCEAVVCIQGDKVDEFSNSSKNSGKSYNGMGTGIIIDERGYIVTNFHVVEGISKIQVKTFDKTEYTANLVARDMDTDLAIIKVNPKRPLKTITLGRSYDLVPGESCIAIGNPYGYAFSLTDGRISGVAREVDVNESLVYRVAIQTNAEINPGNSGGPLINVDGEMIGINAAIRQGASGIAFAIPIDQVIDVAAKLLGEIAEQSATHGLKVYQDDLQDGSASDDLSLTPRGNRFTVVVESVENNSSAAAAGIERGDIIKGIGKYTITNKLDFSRALLDVKSRDDIVFSVARNSQTIDLAVSMGTPRDEVLALGQSRQRSTTPKASTVGFSPKTAGQAAKADEPAKRLDELVWDVLGFRYTEISKNDYQRTVGQYLKDRPHGGVIVKAVREGSQLADKGIMPGDVIVGIHEWVTTSQNDVRYIAKNWSTIKSPSGNVEVQLFRDGQLYFTEVPLK